jgi:hypothetical protein
MGIDEIPLKIPSLAGRQTLPFFTLRRRAVTGFAAIIAGPPLGYTTAGSKASDVVGSDDDQSFGHLRCWLS